MPTEYQVFLNHRGPDSKNNLASLIHGELTNRYGLSVFLDKKEIRTGDQNINAIEAAIQRASVHITIFSESYAQSKWCLDELCMILKSVHNSNKKIIPVFWDVEPSHLRHIENGAYNAAFEKHQSEGRVPTAQIEEWKKALKNASFLSGKLVKSKESDLWETMDEIVNIVIEEVLMKQKSLVVAKYPVGLYQARQDLKEILEQNKLGNTKIVGIGGMSGSGKSTLAKYIYNLCLRYFLKGRSCFLSDVGKKMYHHCKVSFFVACLVIIRLCSIWAIPKRGSVSYKVFDFYLFSMVLITLIKSMIF